MYLVICNNTKDNFLRECKKINFKFHRNWENTGKIVMRKTLISWNLRLLKFAYDIYSLWKEWKRMQYASNYSGTRLFPLKINISEFPRGFHLKMFIIKVKYYKLQPCPSSCMFQNLQAWDDHVYLVTCCLVSHLCFKKNSD